MHRRFSTPVKGPERMFKRTLIVLEPHLHPDALIRHGLALARAGPADIVFYTGLTRTRQPVSGPADRETAAHWDSLDDTRVRAERLHRHAQQVVEDLGVLSRSVIATADSAERGILDAAKSSRCDVIVVACDGSNAVVRLLNGSFIPGLITASPIPVLVCAPRPTTEAAHGAGTDRILVVLEDGKLIQAALQQGLDLARDKAAELLLVHLEPCDFTPVVDATGIAAGSDDRMALEIQKHSQRLLASACAAAARVGLTARGMSLPAGTTAKDIARMAVDHACQLIVVEHRGSNAVMRLLTGSLIPGLITSARTPVLICREAERPPKRRTPRRRLHHHRAAPVARAALIQGQ